MKTNGKAAVVLGQREFTEETYAATVQALPIADCLRVNREAWKLAEMGVQARPLCIAVCRATYLRMLACPEHANTNRVRRIGAVLARNGVTL